MTTYPGRHSLQTQNHRLESWIYADATARLAATGFTIDDIGRIAWQASDNSYWRLSDESPVTWLALAGAATGSGTIFAIDTPPASPTSYDDEFATAGLNAKWTEAITGTVPVHNVNTTLGGQLYVQIASANGDYRIRQPFAPGSAAFTVTACLHGGVQANYDQMGIFVDDGTTANTAQVVFDSDDAPRMDLNGVSGGSFSREGRTSYPNVGTRFYLHLQRTAGTAYTGFYSSDGTLWVPIQLGAIRSVSFTVARLGVFFTQAASGNQFRGSLEWIRANLLTL